MRKQRDPDTGAFDKNPWSMHFTNGAVEDAFITERLPSMFINMSRVMALLFVIVLHQLVTDLLDLSSVGLHGTHTWVDFSGLVITATVSPVVAVLTRLTWFQGLVGYRFCESFMACTHLFLLAWAIAGDQRTWNSYAGEPIPDYIDCHRDMWQQAENQRAEWAVQSRIASLALMLDGFVTVLHLAIPMRWHIFFWLDASYLVAFTVHTLYTNTNDTTQFIVFTFFGLVVGACAGARSQELAARTLFSAIVDERTLRVQAEFKSAHLHVDHLSNLRRTIGREDGASNAARSEVLSSLPRTTPSGEFFQELCHSTDDPAVEAEAARMLRDLGRQEQWLIREDELRISTKCLGRGGFGVVNEGEYCCTTVAVKSLNASYTTVENTERENMTGLNELRILRRIRHPNIVLLHGVTVDPQTGSIRLVLEKLKGVVLKVFLARGMPYGPPSPDSSALTANTSKGDVQKLMPKPAFARQDDAAVERALQGVLRALVYLHSRRPCVVHGDLAPNNVMVETGGSEHRAKLLDFGLAKVVTRRSRSGGGTKHFMAPELHEGTADKPDPATDVYSFGRVLSYAVCGKPYDSWLREGLAAAWGETIDACTNSESSARPLTTQAYAQLFRGSPSLDLSEDSLRRAAEDQRDLTAPTDAAQASACSVAVML